MKAELEYIDAALPWPEPKVPEYRTFQLGKWRLRKTPPVEILYGYWIPVTNVPPGYVLEKKTKGKWDVWMSLTPMELQSHQPHIAEAKGRVVVVGLGMGMALYNFLLNPEVTSILVIEKDQEVINLFDRIVDWKSWPNASCISIVCANGLTTKLDGGMPVDFLYVDIWEKLGTDYAHVETARIAERYFPRKVGYWGQELDYATFLMQNNKVYGLAGPEDFENFCRHVNMNLTGRYMPDYEKYARAAPVLQAAGSMLKKDPVTSAQLLTTALQLTGALDTMLAAS